MRTSVVRWVGILTLVLDADFIPAPPLTGSLLAGLFTSAAAPLCHAVDALPEGVSVSLLYQGELADSAQVFIVRDANKRPLGIVQLSSEAAPGMVARGVARARIAAAALGPALGRAVLLPLSEGEIEGRSYAVMPYCLQFSQQRWRWGLERLRVGPVVLDWLHRITAATRIGVPADDLDRRFRLPLEQVRALAGASERLVACCERAFARLASGAWVPRHVLMHGDLWRGNLLLRRTVGAGPAARRAPWAERLAVIDWAGAQPRGVPFFDLVRVSESLGLTPRSLRSEVARHCALLGCEPVDAPGYVLVAAGEILREIEEFPLARLLAMAEASVERVDVLLGARVPETPLNGAVGASLAVDAARRHRRRLALLQPHPPHQRLLDRLGLERVERALGGVGRHPGALWAAQEAAQGSDHRGQPRRPAPCGIRTDGSHRRRRAAAPRNGIISGC